MKDSTVDHVHVINYAFAIQQLDSAAYNQLKGNDLKAYMEGRALRLIDVDGSAETIFYPLEEDGSMIGMNETKSSFLRMWIKNNKMDRLKIWGQPQQQLTPLPQLQPEARRLKGFYWYDYLRPTDRDDIFRTTQRKAEDTPPKRSARFQ